MPLLQRNSVYRQVISLSALLLGLLCPLSGQWIPLNPVRKVVKIPRGIVVTQAAGALRIVFDTARIAHVQYSPTGNFQRHKNYVVLPQHWTPVKWRLRQNRKAVILASARLSLILNRKSGSLMFTAPGHAPLYMDNARVMKPARIQGRATWHVLDYAGIYGSTESLYGLGQHQAGVWDYHGESVKLTQGNTNIAIPMLVSSRGYGIFWNSSSPTWFNNRLTHAMYWRSLEGNVLDYYFFYGPRLHRVVADYRRLTGQAPLLGRWAYGLWQSKNRYNSQAELLHIAAKYRRLKIPVDNLVQDWFWWNNMGSFQFNAHYPHPAAMMRQLHREHFHVMISVWPYFYPGSRVYDTMKKNGWLLASAIAPSYFKAGMSLYDPTSRAARHYYWDQINQALFRRGFDAWWLDDDEPGSRTRTLLWHLRLAIGSGARYANLYPLMQVRGVYDGQRRTSRKRVFILSRSAFAGSQRYAAVAWSGDVLSDWLAFQRQIPAGLNYSISGLPYWTTDIGGFFLGHPDSPAYRKLFVRWFEYGVFCPILRVHGTRVPNHNELWSYGRAAQTILTKYDRLRYRLLPYIYSEAWRVTRHAGSLMRPLVMDFRHDAIARRTGNEFLFGPSLLVSPVTEPDVKQWTVYLPQARWYNFWTGKRRTGGHFIVTRTNLATEPVYVRAGAIVPLGPELQYASQKPENPIELRIYTGANGHFNLYNDNGITYAYEHGAHETIPIRWNQASRTLTIGARRGSYPGMPQKQIFHVVWVRPGHGVGEAVTRHPDQTIQYDGKPVSVREPLAAK